jgi:hypothetical protein
MGGSINQDRFQRVEQKYLFPAGYTDVIRTWLEHACVPDPRYPSSVVSSIYFDTPELFHFHESRNGEFLRAKVRLRWYTDNAATEPGAGVRCYLEIKAKQGALSEKKRAEVTIPSRVLLDDLFSDEQILDLTARVFGLGYRAAGMLVPILLIQYRRQRYLDVESDSGIALDGEIRCTRANDAVVRATLPVCLDVGVLEIKGMNREACGVLKPIGSYLTKSPFSKYAVSLEFLMQPLGRRV